MTPFVPSQQSFERAVALIYDAVLDPERLPAAIGAVAEAAGAAGGMLGIFDLGAGEGHAPWLSGLDGDLLPLFEAHHVSNPWTDMAQRHAVPGRALSSEWHVDPKVLRATAFYDAILAPQRLVAESFVLLRYDGRFSVGLPLMFTAPGRSTEPEVLRVHEDLARHMAKAFEMMRRLQTLQSRLELHEAALERQRCAVLQTDRHGHIRYANAKARCLLAEGDGLYSIGTRLAARHPGDGQRLAAAITGAASRGDAAAAHARSVPVQRGHERLPLMAIVLPGLPQGTPCTAPASGAGAALVFVSDPAQAAAMDIEVLRGAFGLTAREAEVAFAATRLGSLPAAAAELGIAVTTARTHLQRVFDKTRTRHQVGLAQLLEALAVVPAADRGH